MEDRLWGLLVGVFVCVCCYLADSFARPEVLLVGHVTIDEVPDGRVAGGAITYAAGVLTALGVRACVVTVAGPDADLSVFQPHELYVVPARQTLTFEHSYTWWGHSRKLRVTANPSVTLSRAHVPRHCQRARLVILGPLTQDDVDAASFLQYDGVWDRLLRGPAQHIAYMAQGTQRQLGKNGVVLPLSAPSKQLLAGLGPQVSVFLSDVETGTWSAADIAGVARRSARLLVTQGAQGAQEWNASGVHQIEAVPVRPVLDTNGAGDTFATVYSLALAWGAHDPARVASFAASRAVMQPQACKPACVGHGWRHLSQPWPAAAKVRMDLLALGPHLASVFRHLVSELARPLQPQLSTLWAAALSAATRVVHHWLPGLQQQPIHMPPLSGAAAWGAHPMPPPPPHMPLAHTTARDEHVDAAGAAVAPKPAGMLAMLFPPAVPAPESAATPASVCVSDALGVCPSDPMPPSPSSATLSSNLPARIIEDTEQCDAGECRARQQDGSSNAGPPPLSWHQLLLQPLNRVASLMKGVSVPGGVHAAHAPTPTGTSLLPQDE